jgi:hypothetical protein
MTVHHEENFVFLPNFDKQDKLLYGSGRNWNLARLGKYLKIER